MDFIPRELRFDSRNTGWIILPNWLKLVSTDDFAGPLANQTNLALKAILGIRAMGEIASLTGNSGDAMDFIRTSQDYITKWEKYAFEKNSTHAKLAYQLNESWGSLYNAYADDLLDLHLFPSTARNKQDLWYYKKTGSFLIYNGGIDLCRKVRSSIGFPPHIHKK